MDDKVLVRIGKSSTDDNTILVKYFTVFEISDRIKD
jgi:hypothetical protein